MRHRLLAAHRLKYRVHLIAACKLRTCSIVVAHEFQELFCHRS